MPDMREMQTRSEECAEFGDRLLESIERNVPAAMLKRYAVCVVVYEREPRGACSLSAHLNGSSEREKLCQVLDGCLQLFAGELEAPFSKVDIREREPGGGGEADS
jgi:hypothetical protein